MSKTYLSWVRIRIRSDPVFVGSPGSGSGSRFKKTGSADPDPENMDRIRNTGINYIYHELL